MIKRKLSFIKILSFICIVQFLCPAQLVAQGLDQTLFDQIRRQSGATTTATQIRSPIDQLREQEYLNRLNEQLQKRKDAGPSVIERDYNSRVNNLDDGDDNYLRQFGYAIFDKFPLSDQLMTGVVPDSYRLGVGDTLVVSFKGSREEIVSVRVDSEGRLIIPSLSPMSVAGLTFGDVKVALEQQVSESLIGTEIYLSIATLRQISVLVAGEVENPALVRTTSLATPIEVLLHVGGVKKIGSLRNIILQRGDQRIPVDLYNIIEGSNAEIVNLQDGDRLIVPTIGSTIAVDGNVIRPGIYELPGGQTTIGSVEAMALAGGAIRAKGNVLTHLRFDENGRLNYENLNPGNNLSSGEIIIVNLLENSRVGKISLLGHVKTPGVRALNVFGTVKELIGSVKNLSDDPYLLFGVIERTDPMTQTRQLIAFSLQKALYGNKNVELMDEDEVIIFGRADVEFLKSSSVRQTIFTSNYVQEEFLFNGSRNNLFCAPVKKLGEIISDTQSDRFATAIRAVFVRREGIKEEQTNRDITLDNIELETLPVQRGQPQPSMIGNPAEWDTTALEHENAKDEDDLDYFANCPSIYLEVNNLLSFTLEHIVSVDGAVRLPGVFPITNDTAIDLLLAVSGGTSNDANMSRIEITGYGEGVNDHNRIMNWQFIDASLVELGAQKINPGGGVRVSSVYTNLASGAVLLSGEFSEPGVYTIRKGEKLSSLIARAGGLTGQAYPYGAIFTRDRVREIQQKEMRQTAQRLQSAMISASVKKNIDAIDAITIQRMVNQMADQEFVGRVVIESDPVVLSLDPSKDITLEAGDSLFMPKRPNFIVTVGDVLNPSALQFVPGKGVASYLAEVGGFSRVADKERVFVVYPNGVARPISLASWGGEQNLSIPPGSAIVVPTNLSPYDTLSLVGEIGNIFRNLAVSAASIAILVRN